MIAFPRSVAERDVLATARATVTDAATSGESPQERIANASRKGATRRSGWPRKARINERVSHAQVATLVCGGRLSRTDRRGLHFRSGAGGDSKRAGSWPI